jgi:glycosyltransferase involved in cell wall biosynthesis
MKIVHVIDSLQVGGTENQFLALLPELACDHEIVLVTLDDRDRTGLGELPVSRRYSLAFSGPRSLLPCALKLRKIIAAEKPDLVRSQLYWSSIIARLATPKSVPLIFSIHSTMSADGYVKNRAALWLERLTYRPRHRLLSVSRHALEDFDRHVSLKGPAEVLTNFVRPEFLIHESKRRFFKPPFRLVAVGNLKPVKNFAVIIDAMRELSREIQLDIYGEGSERRALEDLIEGSGVNIRLMGVTNELWNVLPRYDLFVMPSLYEGCPNSAIEAMAVGLPLLLSDIPVMHEVSQGNALFFDPNDPRSLTHVLRRVENGEVDIQAMADRGREIVRTHHLKSDYLKRLNAIYADAVASRRKAADGERR